MTRHRSTNIGDHAIEKIVRILDEWEGKQLTWESLREAIATAGFPRYTRQALERRERIKGAYLLQKARLRGKAIISTPKSPEIEQRDQRIAVLEATIARLERENNNLLEQFQRWAYNASNARMTLDQLNSPLPTVNRRRTKDDSTKTRVPRELRVVVDRSDST